MAWPITSRHTSFTANVTRIAASFLNDIQDKVYGVIGGGKTTKRVTVDAVGDQVPFTEAGSGTGYLGTSFNGSGFAPVLDFHDTTGGAAQVRFYRSNAGFGAWIANAYYNVGTSRWVQEDAAKASYAIAIDPGSALPVSVLKKAIGSGPWINWDQGSIDLLNVNAGGNLIANTGDPASDQARVKAKQIIMSGSAPTIVAASKTGADNGAGDGSGAVTGNDCRMFITVTSGAATGNGAIARVTFNKAYPAGMAVQLTPSTQTATDLGWLPFISPDASGVYFDMSSGSGTHKLATATSYGWVATVIG